jgi:AcrR family transcriptional regulator
MSVLDPTAMRLLEAAGEEFAEKGFEGATIRSICARAGANLAAVNYHFGDKETLYLRAVIEAHRCGVDMDHRPEAEARPVEEELRGLIRHFLSNILSIETDGWHHRLMLREMVRPTVASETLVREVIRPKFQGLLSIVDRIRPGMDDRNRHAFAFTVIGQCLHYRMGRSIAERLIGREAFQDLDLEFLSNHIADVSLAALRDSHLKREPEPSTIGGTP